MSTCTYILEIDEAEQTELERIVHKGRSGSRCGTSSRRRRSRLAFVCAAYTVSRAI